MKFSCLLPWTLSVLSLSMLALLVHAQPANAVHEKAHQAELQGRAQLRAKERKDIAVQRADIEQRQLTAEKACWQRFAVENCLREVRKQSREQDNVLREQELRINSAERQEKAAERLRSIEQKQNEKHVPAPLTASSRSPESAGAGKSPAELSKEFAERDTAASARAKAQAERQQKQQQAAAERELAEAERSAQAQKSAQDKQQAAQARRVNKANDIANRKGTPLPVPDTLSTP